MNDQVLSFPVFISSGDSLAKPMTGYTCPALKRAIVKSVNVVNETPGSGYVSLSFRDIANRMPAFPGGLYPILTSGYIPSYGRLKLLDDYLVIYENEPLILNTLTDTTGNFTAIFSVIEQDLYPEIVTLSPKTVFLTGISNYDFDMYTVPLGKKAIVRSITVNNASTDITYATAHWQDNNQRGIGSTINDYIIFKSGELGAYERFRGVEDIISMGALDVLKVEYLSATNKCGFIATIIEEEAT